jgi:aldehyde dehydrogenase (NAD+)
VRIANASIDGLAGGVYAGSLERAQAVARRLRVGVMTINGANAGGQDIPVGGYKYSGVGRQNGMAGFDQCLELK